MSAVSTWFLPLPPPGAPGGPPPARPPWKGPLRLVLPLARPPKGPEPDGGLPPGPTWPLLGPLPLTALPPGPPGPPKPPRPVLVWVDGPAVGMVALVAWTTEYAAHVAGAASSEATATPTATSVAHAIRCGRSRATASTIAATRHAPTTRGVSQWLHAG